MIARLTRLLIAILFLSNAISCTNHKPVKPNPESVQYEKILNSLGKAHPRKTIKLLKRFHKQSGPVFRSYFLLAILQQKIKEYKRALESLEKVPENERTNEYWYIKMISYSKTNGKGYNIDKINHSVEMLVTNTSFFPQGLDDRIFDFLVQFPNPKTLSKFCNNPNIMGDARCN